MTKVHDRTIRPGSGIVALVAVGLAALALLTDLGIRGGIDALWTWGPWIMLLVWLVWVTAYRPAVEAGAHGVRVINPLRVTSADWAAIRSITLRWQIAFELSDGSRVQAWSVPTARGPRAAAVADPAERELEILREFKDKATTAGQGAITRQWAITPLATLAVTVGWAAATLVV